MATAAVTIDSIEAPSLTTNSEFDEYTQPPAERKKVQSLIGPQRDQDSIS